jgi:hypothetical protein
LVYFMAMLLPFCYIFTNFVFFSPRKIWQPCNEVFWCKIKILVICLRKRFKDAQSFLRASLNSMMINYVACLLIDQKFSLKFKF